MLKASKGMRLQIGIFGRRNAGKSSVLNAITRQDVSIVSAVAGTTTDPIEKPMELLPFGPVLFIDTAGLDDLGALGEKRIERSRKIIERTELALVVGNASTWGKFESDLLDEFKERRVPVIVVLNKTDIDLPSLELVEALERGSYPVVQMVASRREGIEELRAAILKVTKAEDNVKKHRIIGDLVRPGGMVVLVVPIDKEAPKGRIILPQVQTIRDLLDHQAMSLVTTEKELPMALKSLKNPPDLVVTDSQAFAEVSKMVPENVALTSFSILFARYKGDLQKFVEGAEQIKNLKPGDRVLVAESCSHHPIEDDIGRIKIPLWLNQFVGGPIHYDTIQGHDFPSDLSVYKLVIHCGACMFNPKQMVNRQCWCEAAGVPMTNYGVLIAEINGILERVALPLLKSA
jgi:[FeFe] hydrogenase H-cluster maturation GTPase HydF